MHPGKHYKAPCAAAMCPDANSYSHIHRLCLQLDVQQSDLIRVWTLET